mmetsp:Transcript_37108/g.51191  ORF Transcript_37108/g.51191 Transcript_37108/m.51191 type:complete len:205 (-) Transcript_37108:485-1099(-)
MNNSTIMKVLNRKQCFLNRLSSIFFTISITLRNSIKQLSTRNFLQNHNPFPWSFKEVCHFDNIFMTTPLKDFDFCFDHKVMFFRCFHLVNHFCSKFNSRRDIDDIVNRSKSSRSKDFIHFVGRGESVWKRRDFVFLGFFPFVLSILGVGQRIQKPDALSLFDPLINRNASVTITIDFVHNFFDLIMNRPFSTIHESIDSFQSGN